MLKRKITEQRNAWSTSTERHSQRELKNFKGMKGQHGVREELYTKVGTSTG